MGWFDDVPAVIKVGRERFAEQALETWELALDLRPDEPYGERPETDWAAAGLLILAQLQLDQTASILQSEFDIDARLFSGREISRRLRAEILPVRGGGQAIRNFSREIDVVGEGVDLWRALREAPKFRVTHGFEYDGSITISFGPELPELAALGIRASDGMELNASPGQVFAAATECTNSAAELAVRLRIWTSEGYVPEP
ncbi:hypothetical protein [Geodermatophilus nigrescens]|uniref:hypothetical protein n=1 Tax=Geodermatophilus nigrescens TaxID=1070870 RepID=UPI0009353B0E|nr:hypothetical protein [Geodermatophilus nigrescens]